MACDVPSPTAGFISSLTGHIDCQAQILGTGSWQALTAPGSSLSIVLAGFLTIFIALFGYNLLLGNGITVRSGTLTFVKLGTVLALATSWPAYRTVIYDLVTDGPAELISEIGPHAGIVGSDGTLVQRLDLADRALAQLAILGPGNSIDPLIQATPPPWIGFNAFALGGSRILFLLTAIAGLAAVRMVMGLMLALGPFFIAFLMFDGTRSLFEGWVRVIAGSAFAAIGLSIALGLELALIEPWLSNVLAQRMAGESLPSVPTELFVLSMIFTIIAAVAMVASARVARAFRLAPLHHVWPIERNGVPGRSVWDRLEARNQSSTIESGRTRAASIVAVISEMDRRETANRDLSSRTASPGNRTSNTALSARAASRTQLPGGRSFVRRTSSRVSATANRRDTIA